MNAISPGSTETPGLRSLWASQKEVGAQRKKAISSAVPLVRLGTAEEIAKAVVFSGLRRRQLRTGIELFVDGGFAQV